MNNKIYTTLANLFNEVKNVIGNKPSLKDAIDDRINNHTEVLDARGGYLDLSTRFNNIEDKLINSVYNYEYLKQSFDSIKIPEASHPIPTINLGDRELMVSLQDKVQYLEERFVLLPGTQRLITNSDRNTITEIYIRNDITTQVIENVEFTDTSTVLYDGAVNGLSNKVVSSLGLPELYRIPMNTANILYSEGMDGCVIPGLLTVYADYTASSYNNHLINIFREDAPWNIRRSFVSFTVVFDNPTPISKIESVFDTTSPINKFSAEWSNDGVAWTDVYRASTKNASFTLPITTTVKYLKFSYDVYEPSASIYSVDIKSCKIYGPSYNMYSGVVSTINPIPINELNEDIHVLTTGATDEASNIVTRFALSNTLEDTNIVATYVPKSYVIMPDDFYDGFGHKYSRKDVLQNALKVNQKPEFIYFTKQFADYPVNNSLVGTTGNVSMSSQITQNFTDAWKITSRTAAKIHLSLNGVPYTVPIASNKINSYIEVNLGGVDLVIRLMAVSSQTLKAYITTKTVQTVYCDYIKVEVISARMLDNSNGTTQRATVNSNVSVSHEYTYAKVPVPTIADITSVYNVSFNYYAWDFFFWFYQGSGSSGLNGTDRTSVAIAPEKSTATYNPAVSTVNYSSYFSTFISKTNIPLPATAYVSNGPAAQLDAAIAGDIKSVEYVNTNMMFEYTREFVAKVFIGDKSKIARIIPSQTVTDSYHTEYKVSFDNLNYYTLDPLTLRWVSTAPRGMTAAELQVVTDGYYHLIQNGEWLYIKVVMRSPDAKVNNIAVNFDKDSFVLITKDEIIDKGVPKRVLENIEHDTLQKFVQDEYPILKVHAAAKTEYPLYKYLLSGYKITNYSNIQWEKADRSIIREYSLPNNCLLYKNISATQQFVKLIRWHIGNETAIIDTRDVVRDEIDEVKDEQFILNDELEKLKQNVQVLHQATLAGHTVEELPNELLPTVKEIDIPVLTAGQSTRLGNIEELRGIQIWENRSSFVGYEYDVFSDYAHKDQFYTNRIDLNDGGAVIGKDYDRDNPYLCPENYTSINATKVWTPMFDITSSVAPSANDLYDIMDNVGNGSFFFTFYNPQNRTGGDMVYWDLPGENTRWVDMILDFRTNVWISSLNELSFGWYSPSGDSNARVSLANQITTFSSSLDGLEYIDIKKYNGDSSENAVLNVGRELRYIRIRCELPYSANRGAGTVTFRSMNVYFCPTRYIHDTEATMQTVNAIDTSTWLSFNKIKVDRYIDHNPAEMKFVLSDDPSKMIWKYWNGTMWKTTQYNVLAEAMSIETLLALGPDQLNQLAKGSLYIGVIMKTTDTWVTPVLRKITFCYDNDIESYLTMCDINTIGFKYSQSKKELEIVNKTTASKKLKLVLL